MTAWARCKDCGAQLVPGGGEPCPACGSLARVAGSSIRQTIAFRQNIATATRSNNDVAVRVYEFGLAVSEVEAAVDGPDVTMRHITAKRALAAINELNDSSYDRREWQPNGWTDEQLGVVAG